MARCDDLRLLKWYLSDKHETEEEELIMSDNLTLIIHFKQSTSFFFTC